MRRRIAAIAAACALSLATLAGCGQASFTQVLGDAKAELNKLDGTVEGDFDLPYTDIQMDVALESGTVDIEVIDTTILKDDNDNETVLEFDSIYRGEGLSSEEGIVFNDDNDNGQIRVRLTSSDGATSTITFSPQG